MRLFAGFGDTWLVACFALQLSQIESDAYGDHGMPFDSWVLEVQARSRSLKFDGQTVGKGLEDKLSTSVSISRDSEMF